MSVVIVTGPSGCGKSTVCAAVAAGLGARLAGVVHQDDHFTGAFVPLDQRVDDTMEGPRHVDFAGIRAAVARQLAQAAGALVVVEGHTCLCDSDLVAMADRLSLDR